MAKARRLKDTDQTASPAAGMTAPHDASPGNEDERTTGHSPEQIAARAYELYLARGGTHGQDWDDWLAAERELASAAEPRSESKE
ncbi:MAG TPA: DUF2934 domain-containing protein [Vicinamibacterales bacterium]|nr:DUF2934 domain-containing protein [Vicinamibacterales bacterium]